MSNIFAIAAEPRENVGKIASRKLRLEGKLPAIIYGKNKKNHAIAIDFKSFSLRHKQGGIYTQVCEIESEGKKIKVIPKDLDLHPVTDNILHADFYELNDKEKVKIRVKIKFINEERCAGVKKGGVVNIAARKVELLCFPKDIVSEVEVDLVELNIGESIHTDDLKLPESVEIASTHNLTVATIVGRMAEEAETPTGADAAAPSDDDDDDDSEEETSDDSAKEEG